MRTEEMIGVLVPLTFLVLLGIERLAPARRFPPRRGWTWIGLGFLLLAGALSALVPLWLDPAWLARHRWMDGSRLGLIGGVLVGWVAFTGLGYAWHRLQHRVPLLWRTLHQLHHSPNRVDIAGAFFFHPLETVAHLMLLSVTTTLVLGLEPLAAATLGYVSAFHALFQHLNLRTPTWLGWLIQRPESHCEHHRLGVHASNYADLPLWDLLFRTWRNPRTFEGAVGFEPAAARRVGAMLAFADVNATLYGSGSTGAAPAGPAPR